MAKNLNKGIKLINKGPQLAILLHKGVYSLDVLMSACYTFIDKAYFLVNKPDKDHFEVIVALKPDVTEYNLKTLAGEFENQLLEEALRAKIGKKTATIRDRIVTTALAYSIERPQEESGESDLEDLPPEVLAVLQNDDDDLDFLDDPLGIAVPWEDKFDKEKKDDASQKEES